MEVINVIMILYEILREYIMKLLKKISLTFGRMGNSEDEKTFKII